MAAGAVLVPMRTLISGGRLSKGDDVALNEFGRTIDILLKNSGVVTFGTAETSTEEIWRLSQICNGSI